jgi:hypothetical protein
MENHSPTPGSPAYPSGDDAQQVLRDLTADRATLAERLAAPPWLYPLLAALASAYVATPAIPSDDARIAVVGLLMAGTLVALLLYQRLSGVRTGRAGSRATTLLVGLLLGVLLLLSTSYGLVASLNPWWALPPTAMCFALVLMGGRRFDRLYREYLRRGN